MKMTKLTAAAAGLLVAASLAFTSCDGLGKDDFFGLWKSSYVVTADNVLDDTTAGQASSTEARTKIGSTCDVVMYFDGTTEKLISNAKQKFYQFKTRINKEGKLEASTFWLGNYNLEGNANFTHGTLSLDYRVGWKEVTEAQANALGQAWLCSTAAEAHDVLKNAKDGGSDAFTSIPEVKDDQTLINYLATVNSPYYVYSEGDDEELFDFELGGQSFLKGYTTMKATAKKNCSWEVKERNFELQSTLADLVKEMLKGADASMADGE